MYVTDRWSRMTRQDQGHIFHMSCHVFTRITGAATKRVRLDFKPRRAIMYWNLIWIKSWINPICGQPDHICSLVWHPCVFMSSRHVCHLFLYTHVYMFIFAWFSDIVRGNKKFDWYNSWATCTGQDKGDFSMCNHEWLHWK